MNLGVHSAGAWWSLFTTHQKALAELQQQYAGAEVQMPGMGSEHVSTLFRGVQNSAVRQASLLSLAFRHLAAAFVTCHCRCQGWHGALMHGVQAGSNACPCSPQPVNNALVLQAEADAAAVAEGQQPPNLLRDMLCAAVHSRASYGFAMQAGHLASVFNFALMHTLHQIR